MGVKGKDKRMMTGNYAAAYGAKLAQIEVVPAYPITPQTQIMEKLIEFINTGELQARFVPVESEHSAMCVAIAAEATGARSFTASSSQGLAYMHENLFVASGLRLPIVMAAVNRGLAMPISIHPDQTDSLAERDSGWIQYYAADAQETLDLILQAYRVAEDPDVLLPVMVCLEGFLISHFTDIVELPDAREAADFVGDYKPKHVFLDPKRPMHIGILVNEQYYTEYRYQQKVAMDNAKSAINRVAAEYRERFGRGHGLFETYRAEDAEMLVIVLGTLSGLVKLAIDRLRGDGIKVGLIRLVTFRPFPGHELVNYCKAAKTVIVLDRNVSHGSTGIIYPEVAASLCNISPQPRVFDVILGLGGRDVSQDDMEELIRNFSKKELRSQDEAVSWLRVRGAE